MADLAAPRILVAEDDRSILELVETRLLLAGYRVVTARNGRQAVEQLPTRPRAVILDVNMPGLDGFGVLQWMRREGLIRTCPVMMLTARHAREDVQRCLELGAKDYLSKPFSDAVLLTRVARLLRMMQRDIQSRPAANQDDPLLL